MKNKNLIYLALGLGALYFFTKKKDDTIIETETTSPDVGNDKNDPVVDELPDIIDTGVVVNSDTSNGGVLDVGTPTQGGTLPDDVVIYTTV